MADKKWECPFERIRGYPDCFEDCPDIGECKMSDSWKQTRPFPKLKPQEPQPETPDELLTEIKTILRGAEPELENANVLSKLILAKCQTFYEARIKELEAKIERLTESLREAVNHG